GRKSGSFLRLQVRIELIELSDLSICTPAEIPIPGISEIRPRDGLEAARRVEAGRQLVCERLIVDELVVARCLERRFVEALRIELPALDAGDLGADEQRAVLEALRAILCPDIELPLVKDDGLQMLLAPVA